MKRFALVAAFFVLALATATSASTGGGSSTPYVGSVGQGQSDNHRYDNSGGNPCLAIYMPRTYTVTLAHVPTSDVLTLTAAGHSDSSSNGLASVSFTGNYCTAFDIRVTGTAVAGATEYAVAVTSVAQIGGGPVLA